jgi:hypothetical protein
MNKVKEAFTIGTRVRHTSDSKYNEGVVVWKHGDYSSVMESMRGKVWSVHWSNGERGIYANDDIQRIPPKNIKKIVEQQIVEEGEDNAEEE